MLLNYHICNGTLALLNHLLLYLNISADVTSVAAACLHVLHKLKRNYTIRLHRIHPHADMNIDLTGGDVVELSYSDSTDPLNTPP